MAPMLHVHANPLGRIPLDDPSLTNSARASEKNTGNTRNNQSKFQRELCLKHCGLEWLFDGQPRAVNFSTIYIENVLKIQILFKADNTSQ